MASIYYEHVQDTDRDFMVTAKELACDIDQLNAMMLVTEAQYNIDVQRAEIIVLKENGTYDDYTRLLQEAQEQANTNKKGILQSIFEWFSRMFQHIANVFAKANSINPDDIDPNQMVYADADAMDNSEDSSILDGIAKMSGFKKGMLVTGLIGSLGAIGFFAKKFMNKDPGDQQNQQNQQQVQAPAGQVLQRKNFLQSIIDKLKGLYNTLTSLFKGKDAEALIENPETADKILNNNDANANQQAADANTQQATDANANTTAQNSSTDQNNGTQNNPNNNTATQNNQNNNDNNSKQKKIANSLKSGARKFKVAAKNTLTSAGRNARKEQRQAANDWAANGAALDESAKDINDFIFGDYMYEDDTAAPAANAAQPQQQAANNNANNNNGAEGGGEKISVLGIIQKALSFFTDKVTKLTNTLFSIQKSAPQGSELANMAGQAGQMTATAAGVANAANIGTAIAGNLMNQNQQNQGQPVTQSAYDEPLDPNDISLYEAVFGTSYEEDFRDSSFDRELRAVFADI